jgi:hypothetical protein
MAMGRTFDNTPSIWVAAAASHFFVTCHSSSGKQGSLLLLLKGPGRARGFIQLVISTATGVLGKRTGLLYMQFTSRQIIGSSIGKMPVSIGLSEDSFTQVNQSINSLFSIYCTVLVPQTPAPTVRNCIALLLPRLQY